MSGKRDVPPSAPGSSTSPARPSAHADAHGTPPHGVPRDEDSGLHDIRSLARGTIQRVSKERPVVDEDEISQIAKRPSAVLATPGHEVVTTTPVATSASAASPGAPAKRRSPLPIVIVGALAAAGGAFAATKFLSKPAPAPAVAAPSELAPTPTEPVVTPQPVVTPGGATDPALVAGTEAATIPPTVPPPTGTPAEGDKAEKAEKHKTEKKTEDKSVAKDADKTAPKDGEKAGEASTAAAGATPAVAAATPPAAEAKKPAPGSLDELLNEASGPAQAPTEAAPAAPEDDTLPEKISRDDVRTGMQGVKNQVQACYDQYKVSGTYMVKLTIDPSGAVKSADYVTDGDTAKLESGTCVVGAVKMATFKKWRGASLSLTYPFKLQ